MKSVAKPLTLPPSPLQRRGVKNLISESVAKDYYLIPGKLACGLTCSVPNEGAFLAVG